MSTFTAHQKRVLLVLTCINFVNWIDRQVLYPLFPLIREDFHVTYAQLGLLVAVFSLVHSFGALGLGRLADRTSRKRVISGGVLFWSLATFLSGMAGTFRALLGARALVGVGEAAYTPAATAIISGSFRREIRARVQAIFDLGMFLGGATGIVAGGLLAASLGWRPAFFLVGVPGLVLALIVVRLPETQPERSLEQMPLRCLARVPAYLLVLLSGGLVTFAGHTYVIWGVEFLHRSKQMPLRETGLMLGAIVLAMGLPGVMAGALLADRLSRRYPGGRALAVALGCLLAAPLILCALHSSNRMVMLVTFAASTFFMTWYHGPVTAIIHDLIPSRAHASAMGVYYFLVNLIATTAASVLVGRIADSFGLLAGMHTAVAAQVIGGVGFLLALRSIRRHGLHHPALQVYRSDGETQPQVCAAAA